MRPDFCRPLAGTVGPLLCNWVTLPQHDDALIIDGIDPLACRVREGGYAALCTLRIALDRCAALDTDDIDDAVDYVPLLQLLKDVCIPEAHNSEAFLEMCKCSPLVRSAEWLEGETGHNAAATAALIVEHTLEAIIGCAPCERLKTQRLHVRVAVGDRGAEPPLLDPARVTACVAASLQSAKCFTIERASAVVLHALESQGLVPRAGNVVTVEIQKPGIAALTGHNVRHGAFRITRQYKPQCCSNPCAVTAQQHSTGCYTALLHLKSSVRHLAPPLTEVQTAACFRELARRSTEYDALATWLRRVVDQSAALGRTSLRVLDIGCGFGWALQALADACHERGIRLDLYTGFEENAPLAKEASDLATTLTTHSPTRLTARIIHDTFTAASWQVHNLIQQSYDLVLLVHSLYNAKASAVDLILDVVDRLLRVDGVLLVAHQSVPLFRYVLHRFGELQRCTKIRSVVVEDMFVVPAPTLGEEKCAERAALMRCVSSIIGRDVCSIPLATNHLADTLKTRMVQFELQKRAPPSPIDALIASLRDGADVVLPRGSAAYLYLIEHRFKNKCAMVCHQPLVVVQPRNAEDVALVVKWCLRFGVRYNVACGTHSDHYTEENGALISLSEMHQATVDSEAKLLRCEGGVTLRHIVTALRPFGLMVPVGSRPSVGMGLILHGGIGHYSRLCGLSCDYIVDATVVDGTGEIRLVSPDTAADAFACLRGSGSALGVVVSVTLRCVPFLPMEVACLPLDPSPLDTLSYFTASLLNPRHMSSDAYIATPGSPSAIQTFRICSDAANPNRSSAQHDDVAVQRVNCYEDVFDQEFHRFYPRAAHDFKRTLLIRSDAASAAASLLSSAVRNAPTMKCYIHVVQCGCAVSDNATTVSQTAATTVPRGWEWAAVITSRWDADGDALACKFWVYDIVRKARLLGCLVYAVDLGFSFTDMALHEDSIAFPCATRETRSDDDVLLRLAEEWNPHSLHRSPIGTASLTRHVIQHGVPVQQVLVVICGKRFAGKDFVGSHLARLLEETTTTSVALLSVSDAWKKEWCERNGHDFARLAVDRAFKEELRPAMDREAKRASPEDFYTVLRDALRGLSHSIVVVTGMRDAHLDDVLMTLGIRYIMCLVTASPEVRRQRGWQPNPLVDFGTRETAIDLVKSWDVVIRNDGNSSDSQAYSHLSFLAQFHIPAFAKYAAPFYLASAGSTCAVDVVLRHAIRERVMRSVTNFPFHGVDFKDVTGLSQHPTWYHSIRRWMLHTLHQAFPSCDGIATVESGGVLWASGLSDTLPVIVARKGSEKEPPLARSVTFAGSNATRHATKLELRLNSVHGPSRLVLVDDVFSSGATASAVAELLGEGHLLGVICVARFPLCERSAHRLAIPIFSLVNFPSL